MNLRRTGWSWLVCMPILLLVTGCITETTGGFTSNPSPEEALERRVSLARQYIGEGNWENAKRNLQLAADIDPSNAEVYEAFGLVYQSTGEFELADMNFSRALKADPQLSRARNNYAAFLSSMGRYEEAEQQFEQVTTDTLYRARPLAFINLGLTRLRLGNNAGAEQAFARSLSMDRRNPIALLEMGYLRLQDGAPDQAELYYGVYRTAVPRQSPRGLLLGIGIAAASDDADALSSYELALRNLYPDSPEYRNYLAQQSQ